MQTAEPDWFKMHFAPEEETQMDPARPGRPQFDPTELIAQLAQRGFYVLGLAPSNQASNDPSQPSTMKGSGANFEDRT